MKQLATFVQTKPVSLVAGLQALLAVAIAFGLVELDGAQLASVEGLFAVLGVGGSKRVTANTRLDDATLEAVAAAASPWAAPLTEGDDPDLIG